MCLSYKTKGVGLTAYNRKRLQMWPHYKKKPYLKIISNMLVIFSREVDGNLHIINVLWMTRIVEYPMTQYEDA